MKDPQDHVGSTISKDTNGELHGTYKLYQVVDMFDLADALNCDINRPHLDRLAKFGTAVRVVTANAIVFDNQISMNQSTSADVKLSTANGSTNFGASLTIKDSSTSKTTFSDGTVFAYQFSRICWRKSGGRLLVGELAEDTLGPDLPCPSGTSDNPNDPKLTDSPDRPPTGMECPK
jgi:hypothetical protein